MKQTHSPRHLGGLVWVCLESMTKAQPLQLFIKLKPSASQSGGGGWSVLDNLLRQQGEPAMWCCRVCSVIARLPRTQLN